MNYLKAFAALLFMALAGVALTFGLMDSFLGTKSPAYLQGMQIYLYTLAAVAFIASYNLFNFKE